MINTQQCRRTYFFWKAERFAGALLSAIKAVYASKVRKMTEKTSFGTSTFR